MKKDRDLLDFVNTAANVAQTLELHAVNKSLAAQSQREERKEREADREDRLREHIFQLQDDVDILLRRMQAHPRPAMALALEIKRVMQTQSITTAQFRSYEDKEGVKKVLKGLDVVCDKCGPRLTSDEKADVNKYLEIRAQMPALDCLIALASKTAELENSKRQLSELETEKAGRKPPAWYIIGLVLGGVGAGSTIICLIGLCAWDWPWQPLAFTFPFWIVGVVVKSKEVRPKAALDQEELSLKVESLRKNFQNQAQLLAIEIDSKAATISNLCDQIGRDLSLAEYQHIKADREAFIQKVLAT